MGLLSPDLPLTGIHQNRRIQGARGSRVRSNVYTAEEIVEYPNRQRWLGLSLAAAVFVVLGLFMVFGFPGDEQSPPLAYIVVGIICILFFGFCFLHIVSRLINPRPSIVINREGINDQSSAISGGSLKWHEIKEIMLFEFMGQHFIGLQLHDTAGYLAGQSGMKKLLMRLNKRMVQATVNISQQSVRIPLDQLYAVMETYWLEALEKN